MSLEPIEPVPVSLVSPDPVPVTLAPDSAPIPVRAPLPAVQSQRHDPSLPATTTFEQNLTSAGQRAVNLIWETTQMKVALSVIWAALIVSATLAVLGKYLGTPDLQLAAIVFLFGVANLVTGFYFGRTNHTKTGGVGPNEAGR